ncbi:MAG: hypothetical protein WCG75_12465 [Armatimonadota bacterium]
MQPSGVIEIPKFVLQVLNNLCDIDRKLSIHGDPGNARRNVERIKETIEDIKVFYEDPMGQSFSETRTDLEATITGEGTDNLKVVEVIKPIIRVGDRKFSRVVQKGIVIVQSDTGEK